MKIWNAFGTEHSMNLVMIGRFKEVRNAEEAKRLIDRLTEQVIDEEMWHTKWVLHSAAIVRRCAIS